jgi:hypothetical protein
MGKEAGEGWRERLHLMESSEVGGQPGRARTVNMGKEAGER